MLFAEYDQRSFEDILGHSCAIVILALVLSCAFLDLLELILVLLALFFVLLLTDVVRLAQESAEPFSLRGVIILLACYKDLLIVHLLHQQGLLVVLALHALDAAFLDAVEDLLFGRPVDNLQDLQLDACGRLTFPLFDTSRIERRVGVSKVAQIVSRNSHYN